MKKASIIVATHNREDILEKTLNAMLRLDYPDYEIIVVDDASTDETPRILKRFEKKVKIIKLKKNVGPAKARNIGIKASSGEYVVIMDDDCIPDKTWLKDLIKPFSGSVGATSSFDIYGGGTSTAFLRRALKASGLFDEEFPYPYREDTDLVFRILDKGYIIKPAKAKFRHVHPSPVGLKNKVAYGIKRIKYHSVDPLLYKKHPERTKDFLDIKLGFIRNPIKDFKVATGLWRGDFAFSSPQGVVLIKRTNFLSAVLIFILGLFYVFAVKFSRLYGSVKYGKMLI